MTLPSTFALCTWLSLKLSSEQNHYYIKETRNTDTCIIGSYYQKAQYEVKTFTLVQITASFRQSTLGLDESLSIIFIECLYSHHYHICHYLA